MYHKNKNIVWFIASTYIITSVLLGYSGRVHYLCGHRFKKIYCVQIDESFYYL